MKKIGLVACTKRKLGAHNNSRKYLSKRIYIGRRFRKAKEIILRKIGCNNWLVLSSKYNLLEKDKKISYYNMYLKEKEELYKKEWSKIVIEKLKNKYDLSNTVFYIFAEDCYYKNLLNDIHCFIFNYDEKKNKWDLNNSIEYIYGIRQ